VRLIDGTDHIALFSFNGKVRSADAGAGDSDEGQAETDSEATADAVGGEVQRVFLPQINR
jgi:hypothetical protein